MLSIRSGVERVMQFCEARFRLQRDPRTGKVHASWYFVSDEGSPQPPNNLGWFDPSELGSMGDECCMTLPLRAIMQLAEEMVTQPIALQAPERELVTSTQRRPA